MTQHQKNDSNHAIKLYRLINSVFWFIDIAAIIPTGEKYRLIVHHKRETLVDKVFHTYKAATVSYGRKFKSKKWRTDVKPDWSHLLETDESWMIEQGINPDNCKQIIPEKKSA